jgi:predicted Zn finger-like uncharacterized protein
MLKVECESCQAPYQVDERRVPRTGLKMRCPKCGHSFVVNNLAASAQADSPARVPSAEMPSDFPSALGSLDDPGLPVISANLPAAKKQGADLPALKKPAPPRPAPKAPPAPPAAKPEAAAVAEMELGDIDLDLPSVPAGLPTPSRGRSSRPPAPSASMGIDLPAPVADLPSAKRSSDFDLPSIAADLPVAAASLPVVSASLPSVASAGLPSVASAGLPSVAASLPSPAASLPVAARGFGEIALPTVAESLPTAMPTEHHLPARSPIPDAAASTSFGEIELPREPTFVALPPPVAVTSASPGREPSTDFADLELDEPRSRGHISARPSGPSDRPAQHSDPNRGGGMSFGEVDLATSQGEAIGMEASIGVDSPAPSMEPAAVARPAPARLPAAAVAVRTTGRLRPAPTPAKRSIGKRLTLGLAVALVLGGASLQLTPHGAYGYLDAVDLVYAKDYEQAAAATIGTAEKALATDTYDEAKRAIDAAAVAHDRMRRARSLTAFAAIVDFATTVHFGPDTARASRAKQLLAEFPPESHMKYVDVARAAEAAAGDDLDKARRGLDSSAGKYEVADPLQVEIAVLRGDVELAAKDARAATVAFQRALQLSNDARGHFGLARARDMSGDAAGAQAEIAATLAASPLHPGALTMRARMKSAPTEEAQALRDLATVLDGPARSKAAPKELSRAYAARAWVHLERGSASDARDAFAQAVKLDPRNVAALSGEGHLFLNEGRYTEALARFETVLQQDPGSPDAIADDAEAKLALERLADAKQQLIEARKTFPKSVSIMLLLGKVEQHLGNSDAAEADLRAAVAMVDPLRREGVMPYVALSELLSSRGRLADAKATLDEARKKLAPSATLDRALGQVAELQGEHDVAVTLYRSAIAKDPRDVASHFRLAVTLRRIRKFDEAGIELDQVYAVDKDYPGLSLERGLLFEETGDVEKAIEQFNGALARAPGDPDLQLRVGSAYVVIGRPDDAIPILRKVLEERPTSAEAHHFLGRALMLKSPLQQAEALRYLKRAVDLNPNRAEFHVYLAWAANEAIPAQLELARDEIDKALALDSLDAESYWQKGVLERMEGAIEDAIKDEKRALELRPSRYEAHATLAECYEDRNDERTAMAEWAKVIASDGDIPAPDGGVRHPYWRYKYGKLLIQHGNAAAALPLLLAAATTIEKSEQRPAWLAPLEFLTAEALRKGGRKAEAIEHYRRFMDIAPVSSPDRTDAQTALTRLGGGDR